MAPAWTFQPLWSHWLLRIYFRLITCLKRQGNLASHRSPVLLYCQRLPWPHTKCQSFLLNVMQDRAGVGPSQIWKVCHKWKWWRVVGRSEAKRKLKRTTGKVGFLESIPLTSTMFGCLSLSRNFMLTTICFLNFLNFTLEYYLYYSPFLSFLQFLPCLHPSPALSHLYGIFLFNWIQKPLDAATHLAAFVQSFCPGLKSTNCRLSLPACSPVTTQESRERESPTLSLSV